jgi:hypothetical protein
MSAGVIYLDEYKEAYDWTNRMFPIMLDELQEVDWRTDMFVWTDNGVRIWWKSEEK